MQCLAFICGGQLSAKPLNFTQSEQAAGTDAACKLMVNFDKVVQDIVNEGPIAVGGGQLTQVDLKRVDPKNVQHVQAMVKAACGRLLGKEITKPSKAEEALVWNQAARFLGGRIQGSQKDCPGREADMSPDAAKAMRTVLGQVEAGCKILSNREVVRNDITNPAPKSQIDLKRVDSKYKDIVDAMLGEVSSRLLGQASSKLPVGDSLLWAQAAKFLAARIQEPSDWEACVSEGFSDRKSDMSAHAALALRVILGQLEAAIRLMSNRENVVLDITNPGPKAVKGGALTQLDLKRVDRKDKASVDKMVGEVLSRLLGNEMSMPSTTEEASIWTQAAAFLSKRIQSTPAQCDGRSADMSPNAARQLRAVLAQVEAGAKLMSNRKKVVQDITNPGPSAVGGGQLTQLTLKRVDSRHQALVDAMVGEVCSRLFGKRMSEPSSPAEAQVWTQAAIFLNGRIQRLAADCPGRDADMGYEAAAELRAVLAQIPNQTKTVPVAATALYEALMTDVFSGDNAKVCGWF